MLCANSWVWLYESKHKGSTTLKPEMWVGNEGRYLQFENEDVTLQAKEELFVNTSEHRQALPMVVAPPCVNENPLICTRLLDYYNKRFSAKITEAPLLSFTLARAITVFRVILGVRTSVSSL